MIEAVILDSVGFGEWFVLLAVVLIVVGPKKLPSAARQLGQYYSKFKRAAESFKRQILDMDTEFTRAVEEAAAEPPPVAEPPQLPEASAAVDAQSPEPSQEGVA